MRDLAVWANGLSKQYMIGEAGHRPDTLRDHLTQNIARWLKGDGLRRRRESTIWALRGVSFEVKRGEVVGVIGRNGAGKSTLLKVLSRITEPTAGAAEIRGRVGSLLEVGTGFHPDLTGMENLYLNGAILGMKKDEIKRKRDEIIAFAGVERFIDTPVKHYSSGMSVRLAFAVAAHLRPEILLVDEVLAVGDVEFQKKCLGKMSDVASEGRTVLFVSHNLGAITQLCRRALWIDGGLLKIDGPATDVVAAYLSSSTTASATWQNPSPDGARDGRFRFTSVRVLSAQNEPTAAVAFSSPFRVEIGYEVRTPLRDLAIICRLTDAMGHSVWTSWDTDITGWGQGTVREAGRYVSTCSIPPHLLRPGPYYVRIAACDRAENYDDGALKRFPAHENVVTFEVSEVGYLLDDRAGIITPLLHWEVRPEDGESQEDLAGGDRRGRRRR